MPISNNIYCLLKYKLVLVFSCFCILLAGQSSYFKTNDEAYEILDRFQHRSDELNDFHFSARQIARSSFFAALEKLNTDSLWAKYKFDRAYLLRDTIRPNSRQGLFKNIYSNPAHFLSHKCASFEFVINPILNLNVGQDFSDDRFIFQNTRGLELYGQLDKKLYFYTSFYENQSNFLSFIEYNISRYSAILGQGNYKDYQSKVIDAISGFDYSNAQAYLGFSLTPHTVLELGHGKHFIGNGIRSLLLSDVSHNYFYFKFKVEVWKILYQTVIAELSGLSARFTPNNELLPKKYMATHYLDFHVSDRLTIGLFESVIFSREDQFELQYLNPLILYRTVEHGLDSPDNVLLGLNVSWRFLKGVSIYGQVLIDELNLSELTSSQGWWGNKYGFQLGAKYYDVLDIDHLDLQIELNRVRPFTYSHRIELEGFEDYSITSYSHYNQPLAHPLGSNFNEYILKLNYRISNKLRSQLRFVHAKIGRNFQDNFGGDILRNNSSRIGDYNHSQLQGALSTINMLDFHMSYELFYRLFIDLNYRYRNDQNEYLGGFQNNYLGIGIRYNVSQTQIDY